MKLTKSLADFVQKAAKSDDYWIEKVKFDFALDLDKRRRSLGMTSAQFARQLGTSPAYVAKVFRGDANLTIESMVKLARAAGANVSITISDTGANARKANVHSVRPRSDFAAQHLP